MPRVTPFVARVRGRGTHEVTTPDPLADDDRYRVRNAGSRRRTATTGQSGHQTQHVRGRSAAAVAWSLSSRERYRHGARPSRRCTLRLDAHVEIAVVERGRSRRRGRHHAPPSAYTRTAASTGHGPTATSTDARSRARATSRRASPDRTRSGTVATTNATPSSNAATTVLHRSAGQRRITAHRSSSTPAACRGPRTQRAVRVDRSRPTPPSRSPRPRARASTDVTPAPSDTVDRDRRTAPHPAARQQLPERPGDREPAFARRDERPDLPRDLPQSGRIDAAGSISEPEVAAVTARPYRTYVRYGKRALTSGYWTGDGLYSRPRASKDQPASSP